MGKFEIFENFVDAVEIQTLLSAAQLDENETASAVVAIQKERAQFVVDAAALELGRLAVAGEQRKAELIREIEHIDKQNLSIYQRLRVEAPRTRLRESDADWRKRLSYLCLIGNFPEFLVEMSNEPPFMLYFEHADGVDKFDWDYIKSHKSELEVFSTVSTASRAYHYLSRAHVLSSHSWPPGEAESFRHQWGVDKIVVNENQEAVALHVGRPEQFFTQAGRLENFGLKSAKAVIAVAYLQRQQYLDAQGQ